MSDKTSAPGSKTSSKNASSHNAAEDKVRTKVIKRSFKKWVAALLFGAIIIVFVFFGMDPGTQFGDATGGVAAMVNSTPITLAEYRTRVQSIEENARTRFADFPEPQRRAFAQEMRRRALDDLIVAELIYQEATRRGITAADAEVRDYILQIPFLQENGRFVKERYNMFLENMVLTSEGFERQVRKQIVGQKLQELFVGSVYPVQGEIARTESLASQKVNVRFVSLREEDLETSGALSAPEIAKFQESNAKAIEAYYKANQPEFTRKESARARHLLVRVDDKRSQAEALKVIEGLRKEATPQTFATLASKHSDDPGSKAKGGDLGEFSRGQMVPEFEKVAFSMNEGEVSAPVKTDFGYHLIYLEGKSAAGVQPLASVNQAIARKLLARQMKTQLVDSAKSAIASGAKKDVEAWVSKSGLKWEQTGEFDLASDTVPKLGGDSKVFDAVLKRGKAAGVVPELLSVNGAQTILEVTSWREVPTNGALDKLKGALAENDRMVAYRRSSGLMETWAGEIEKAANVDRNPRLTQ